MGRVKCAFEEENGGLIHFTMTLDGGGSCAGALRRCARSKRVRLIVDDRGLTVTVPRSFRYKRGLAPILERHLDWIQRSFAKVRLRPRKPGPALLPDVISLPALEEMWRVEVLPLGERKRTSAKDGVILLPGDFNRTEALMALRRWLCLRAKEALPPWLLELAAEQGLTVERVFVKNLKSRLGSCSSRRNINLNARLLFLTPGLVRHIMLHELCHLLEMNHSPAFYDHLRAMDPEADRHRAELRSAWQRIPSWASEPL